MSSSSTKDSAALQTTRQLLDELDTLMERMLALPIEDGEPRSTAPETPAVAATLTLLDDPAALDSAGEAPHDTQPANDREPATDGMDAPSGYATAIQVPAAPSYTDPAEPDPTPLREVGVPALEKLLPLPRLTPRPALSYQFLLWINRRYDRSTYWLGRPGRWLRTGAFRLLMGLAGLALLGLAVGWLSRDWFGR
jgi:hypothetical protein